MIDIVVDFSKREGYLLQPTKSIVLPVKSKWKSMEINDGFWKLNNCNMPIVTQASHIGIQNLKIVRRCQPSQKILEKPEGNFIV